MNRSVLLLSAIVFISAGALCESVHLDLKFARMDTAKALPDGYTYSSVTVHAGLPGGFQGAVSNPHYMKLRTSGSNPTMLVFGEVETGVAFYVWGESTGSQKETPSNKISRGGNTYYEGVVEVSGVDGSTEMLLAIEYNATSGRMMYRRLDYRHGVARVGSRVISVALVSENELSFGKDSYASILIDENADGEFRMEGEVDWLGRYHPTEAYEIRGLFPFDGEAYEAMTITPDGYSAEIVPAEADRGLNVGLRTPNLGIPALEGEKVSLFDLRGKVVVLNWWHTRCSPCIEEMPGLNALVENYNADEVVFLAIADNTKDELTPFFDSHRFDYRIMLTTDRLRSVLGKTYPRHVVIDQEGKVVYNQTGGSPRTGQKLDKVVSAIQ